MDTARASLDAQLKPAPDATSYARNWPGVVVNVHHWTSGGSAHSPVLDHDLIAMRATGVARLTQRRDGKTHSETVGTGNVTVHARGMESRWNWDQPGAIVILRIPYPLLQEAAEATLKLPRPELRNCFGGRDLFTERVAMQFVEELKAPPHPSQAYITQALSQALAAHLLRRYGTQETAPSRQPSRLHPRTLQRITDFIEANLHEHIDLATLASIANVSRFHFARLFRASTGVSAMAYLEKCRMERAQALIRRGDLQLASIASLVGYDDPSYFTRRFRHFCGQTPSGWARSH